jgi:hypothetical protein
MGAVDNTDKAKKQEAELNRQLHESVKGLMNLDKKNDNSDSTRPQPAAKMFTNTKEASKYDTSQRSQVVQVPIDEVQAIGMQVQPTYRLDDILSVTLKSFRKVVGFDTFNSILKKSRDEKKDPADYYNITVSMMVKRNPENTKVYTPDVFEGGKSLGQVLDKGFPYDDGDINAEERVRPPAAAPGGKIVGKLNGENISSTSLKNLVQDRTSPISLAQTHGSDGAILSSLLGENVTRGALKNLVTDKPAPITVALAQTQGNDGAILSSLLGENVTRGALKNLVTDKPAPITVALAQKPAAHNLVQLESRGNDGAILSSLLGENVTRGALKNLVTDKPAPITVSLAQVENPVVNPPFNNWSVNQPAPPHDTGLAGKEDLGQNIIVDGHAVHFAQMPVKLAQVSPAENKDNNQPGNFFVQDRDNTESLLTMTQDPAFERNPYDITQEAKLANKDAYDKVFRTHDDGLNWRPTVPGDIRVTDRGHMDPSAVQVEDSAPFDITQQQKIANK